MAKIRILDENTINKIAAGEVIENPSNCVKELIENSIDAGAKNILIELKDGGLSLIKIVDDGAGLDYDDIENAFIKHATSKLTTIDDIYNISSYGFRGEALSSIASVSDVRLVTSVDGINGYEYNISYGKNFTIDKAASNKGTIIEIKNLFENIPVRKKFLHSEQKEGSLVEDLVTKLAMVNENISFKLIIDSELRFKSSGSGDLKDNIYNLYGRNVYDNLIKMDAVIKDIHIYGYITKPQVVRNNRKDEIYFVNDRYIKSDIIRNAIEDAYSSFLMQHKFPLVIFKIDIEKNLVDVNVHPKKMEVRFSDDELIYYVVYNAIYNSLKNIELIHEEKLSFDYNNTCDNIETVDYEISNDTIYTNENPKDVDELDTLQLGNKKLYDIEKKYNDRLNVVTEKPFITKTLSEDHRYIGQVFATYILVEFDEKLYIIDQHAAHEKINFEKLMCLFKENKVLSQKVFPSIVLNLTPLQYEAVSSNIDEFKKLGYEINLFGDNDIKVDSVPYNIMGIGTKELLIDMIDTFSDKNNHEVYDSVVEKLASISCKKAIKGNRILSELEVKNLLRELFKLDNPYNCPHGRPTIISLSKNEFERRFGRIV